MKQIYKYIGAVVLAVAALACGKKNIIHIDGSSTVYPVSLAAAQKFEAVKTQKNVYVIVSFSGTGSGFKKFCAREKDINDASRPIKQKEMELCEKNGVKYQMFTVGFDGLSVVVNKDNNFVKQLTVEQLNAIFRQENPAKTWKEVNPAWPDLKIEIFAPGDASGTHDYFVEAILGEKMKMRRDAAFNEDDNVLVQGISGQKGAIGFFGLAYFESNKDKLKLVPIVNPKTNKPVSPTLETVKSGDYAPLSRPLLLYASHKALQRPEVQEFLNFYLSNATDLNLKAKYIPLEKESYAQQLETLAKTR